MTNKSTTDKISEKKRDSPKRRTIYNSAAAHGIRPSAKPLDTLDPHHHVQGHDIDARVQLNRRLFTK